jgi:cell division protein FtsN
MKLITLITLFAGILIFSACNKKQKTVPVPVLPEIVEAIEPDTTYYEEIIEEVIEEPVQNNSAANDKYFLIKASFVEYSNAEKCQQDLQNKGLQSEIIQREQGPNPNFYKVSYMSFSSRQQAISTLNNERNSQGTEDVWLLIK